MYFEYQRQLRIVQDSFAQLQENITLLRQHRSLTSSDDLEQLVRISQAAAIQCRELWAMSREDSPSPYRGAPTPVGAITEGWRISTCSGDLVEIQIPLLLPKRSCPNARFITEPLNLLLSSHQAGLPVFRRCVVLFRHIYGPELPLRDVRDHDNLESRSVLNVIERYLLTSDNGIYCTNIHQTVQGGRTGTVILIAGSPNQLEGRWRLETA